MSKQKEKTVKWIFEMDKDLDDKFRKAIGKKGAYRGLIRECLTQAISDWVDNNS